MTDAASEAGDACRLVELRASNFLRLSAVQIRPEGGVVEITGKNGEGKTSVLRAFWAAVRGKAALAGVAPIAVKEGAEAGDLYLDLGRVKITRHIERDAAGEENWALKLIAGDRRITSKPQAMLDAIAGDGLMLDPMEFSRWDARRQFDALRRLVPGFDFDANAAERAAAFAERTDVKREAARLRAAAASVELPTGPEPKAVDVADALAALERATSANEETGRRAERRAAVRAQADAKMDEAEQLRARASSLEAEARALDEKLDKAEPLPAVVDVAPLRRAIEAADANRSAIEAFARRRAHEAGAGAQEAAAEELTALIERLDQKRTDAIAAAALPVPGLTLGDGAVLLNGLPFSQASLAEKIRTSMAIAMATAGDLHVVMIDEGSELDSASLAAIEQMVAGTDFVVLVCRVDESGERGWVIQDGRVARAPAAKPQPTRKR